MKLKKIIEKLNNVKVEGRASIDIKGLSCNSKMVKDGYLFIAIKGSHFNGTDFINEAIDKGACAIVTELDYKEGYAFKGGVTYIYVNDARYALSEVVRVFYGDISRKMRLIGVTGTNGKTTTTYLVESLFKARSIDVGVIGTVNYRFLKRSIPAINTTPGVLDLYSLLTDMYKEGIRDCILEVSSHSLDQGRVDTLYFDIAIFTNLSSEHMDYHKGMEDYLESKLKLFTKIKQGGYAIVNKDDHYGNRIIEKLRLEKDVNIVTYGIDSESDVFAEDIYFSPDGIRFRLCVSPASAGAWAGTSSREVEIESPLIGQHNVYNMLACAACGLNMGMALGDIKRGIEGFLGVPGRLEKIDCGQDFLAFVDYAHTEDGLENVLKALRQLRPRRLLTVFGCGGDRDVSKRPNMGRVASRLSDIIYITTDNPRNEEPADIARQVVEGVEAGKNNYFIELDRFKAINQALSEARKGDIVLIAGKGHESYQVFKDVTVPFDDRKAVKRILKEKNICLQSKTS